MKTSKKMKKLTKGASSIVLLVALLFVAVSAEAITYTFSDRDFIGGASWGSMDIKASTASQLMITYSASSAAVIGSDSQATGVGFTFIPSREETSQVPESSTLMLLGAGLLGLGIFARKRRKYQRQKDQGNRLKAKAEVKKN